LSLKNIPKILYSPVKAFSEISKKPKVFIPILIIVVILLVNLGVHYAAFSRFLLERGIPEKDEWTEPSSIESNFWTTNGILELDYDDKYVGNASIKSTSENQTVWMRINLSQTINCSEYDVLHFRFKWSQNNGAFPNQGAQLRLFSDNTNYFLFDMVQKISSANNTWANVTIAIGPKSMGWSKINSPDWESINALEFKLQWSEIANLTMKIDDLYFGGKFATQVSFITEGLWFIYTMALSSYTFLRWTVITIIIIIIFKILRFKFDSWRNLFSILGYTLIIDAIYRASLILLFFSLPTINFPLRAWMPVDKGEKALMLAQEISEKLYNEYWYNHIAYLVFPFLRLFFYIWFAVVIAALLRALYGFSWSKSILIATLVSFLSLFLLVPLFAPFIIV
jgi:hypothetical protein